MFWIMASEVYAFSIGELHVKSKFGEKFDASFNIELDFDGPSEPLGINFRVVVGAFKKAYNATWMLQQLKQFGFAGELISP